MGFLTEVNIRKMPKIGSMLSEIDKFRKFWHFCCQIRELYPFFHKLRFGYPNVSTFRSMDILFSKTFRGLNKTSDYCLNKLALRL